MSDLVAQTIMLLWFVTDQLAAGKITTDQWYAQVMVILAYAHGNAAAAGRVAAGLRGPADAADMAYGSAVAETQRPFLDRFSADLQNGRYSTSEPQGQTQESEGQSSTQSGQSQSPPSGLNIATVKQRVAMYARRIVGTANEAFVLASPPGSLFDWELGGNEDHCTRCPELAAAGPYTAESLPTYPGACDTPCLTNCKCRLRRQDGATGFEIATIDTMAVATS